MTEHRRGAGKLWSESPGGVDDDAFRAEQEKYWARDQGGRRPPSHRVVEASFEPVARIVAAAVEEASLASVLDVGCGNGFLHWALERRFQKVVGLDSSRQMLERNPCRCKCLGSAVDLPFPDNCFDVVTASHLLHHLTATDRLRALSEMRRVARRAVVSSEPNRCNPLMFALARRKAEERLVRDFDRVYLRRLFQEANLAVESVDIGGWILPNRAPVWWIPLGRLLDRTPLRQLGVDICVTARPGGR